MAGEQLLIDPTDESSGTQLDITDSTLGYFLLVHEYPDPDPEVVMTGSIDTEGERPAAGKHKPRTITVKIRCAQPSGGSPSIGTMVSNLQRKVGKLWREGGTLRRVLPSGDSITFDVLRFGARIDVTSDKRWVNRGLATVTLTFTCKPYGRGAEVDLGDNAETTLPCLIFTGTGIEGDVPALVRLVVDEDGGAEVQKTVLWGFQSRYYDSAASAALFYEAESLTADAASVTAGPAGASGAGNNTMFCGTLPNSGLVGCFSKEDATHVGTFRVIARVQLPATNAGVVSCNLSWHIRDGGAFIENDAVEIPAAYEGSWRLVDLGTFTASNPTKGTQKVALSFNAGSTVANDDIYWDWVALIPVDEGWGQVIDPRSGGYVIPISGHLEIASTGVLRVASAGSVWGQVSYEGDLPVAPPAGAEGRTLRVFVKATRGRLVGAPDPNSDNADAAIEDISAQLFVTPRFLNVPAP
jgi:hypothetical protein